MIFRRTRTHECKTCNLSNLPRGSVLVVAIRAKAGANWERTGAVINAAAELAATEGFDAVIEPHILNGREFSPIADAARKSLAAREARLSG